MNPIESYLNSIVEFFTPYDNEVLKGIVTEVHGKYMNVEIQYGPRHGMVYEISLDDLIEDYGFPEDTEEKIYKWEGEN